MKSILLQQLRSKSLKRGIILLSVLLVGTQVSGLELNIGNEAIVIKNKDYVPLRKVVNSLVQMGDNSNLSITQDGKVVVLKGTQDSLNSIVTKDGVSFIATSFLKERYDIDIVSSRPPVITGITGAKKAYGIGEPIALGYTYEAGSGAAIHEEKWSYYKEGSPKEVITGKPDLLFVSGDYVVNLSLQDDKGNWSNKAQVKLRISDEVVESELHYQLTKGEPGDIANNFKKVDYLTYKDAAEVAITTEKGKLLVSNSPERVTSKVLLYRDTVKGKGRLVLHHANGFTEEENALENKRLMVTAKNVTDKTLSLTVKNKSIKGPHIDILRMGQEALQAYLGSPSEKVYTLAPGEEIYLYDSKALVWKKDQVISGLFDFETTDEVQFTVASGGPDITFEGIRKLPIGEKGVHIRGTFDTLDQYYTVDLTQEESPVKLVIGREKEEWVTGYDALTGEPTYDMGNYGVNTYIQVKVKEDTGILFNPRGGVFRGAVKWENGSVVALPKEGYFTNKDKATVVGTVKGGEEKTFTYMLPNGSAAPGLFAFVPEREWNE